MITHKPRVWFITGASSGFGRSMTELVLDNGDIAVATLRRPEVISDLADIYAKDRLLILQLDVTKPGQISEAFKATQDAFGRLDVVFNNAGYSLAGEIEGTPDKLARENFEVLFWGAANVSREAVRFFREVNEPGVGGMLLQNSSCVGIEGVAGAGYYVAAKFALEGFTESLVKELDPKWNIKITIVEPGPFHTSAVSKAVITPVHPAYTDPTLASAIYRGFINDTVTDGDLDKANKAIYRLLDEPQPPLRFPLGKSGVLCARNKIASLKANTDQYESWSENLSID